LGRTSSFGWTEPIDPGQPKLSRKGIGVNTPTALVSLFLCTSLDDVVVGVPTTMEIAGLGWGGAPMALAGFIDTWWRTMLRYVMVGFIFGRCILLNLLEGFCIA